MRQQCAWYLFSFVFLQGVCVIWYLSNVIGLIMFCTSHFQLQLHWLQKFNSITISVYYANYDYPSLVRAGQIIHSTQNVHVWHCVWYTFTYKSKQALYCSMTVVLTLDLHTFSICAVLDHIRTTPHQENSPPYRYWSWWVVLFVASGPGGELS